MPASVQEKNHVDIHTFNHVRERNNYTDEGIDYPSPENMDFWNGNPPEEIIVSTGSIRKAIMAIQLMNGFVFTSYDGDGKGSKKAKSLTSPLDLQSYYDQNIHNGDGHLPEGEKVLLGYYHDIPVYAQNGNGEGHDNFPVKEAEKKALTLVGEYLGKDVIIVAGDTVNHPAGTDVPLGKPMNDHEYPQRNDYDDETSYSAAVEKFNAGYIHANYIPGDDFMHANGVAVVRTGIVGGDPVLISEETTLQVIVAEQTLEIYSDCSGGGALQQLIDWLDELSDQIEAEELFRTIDEKFSKEDDPEVKKAYTQWLLMCQISGMPWWFISKNISEIAKDNGNTYVEEEILLENGKPVQVRRLIA